MPLLLAQETEAQKSNHLPYPSPTKQDKTGVGARSGSERGIAGTERTRLRWTQPGFRFLHPNVRSEVKKFLWVSSITIKNKSLGISLGKLLSL